eukprot:498959_1
MGLNVGEYITSNHGIYNLNHNNDFFTFYMKNYKKYLTNSSFCRMEICIEQLPTYLQFICIEMDIFIVELSLNYSISPIWINNNNNNYGLDLFHNKKLKYISSLTIKLSIKLIGVQHLYNKNTPKQPLKYTYKHQHKQEITPYDISYKKTQIRSIFRKYHIARLVVFGVGISVLPPKQSKLMTTILLGTSNCFNWIYAYKYLGYFNSQISNTPILFKETIVTSIYLYLAKYLYNNIDNNNNDQKYIGIGITLHG